MSDKKSNGTGYAGAILTGPLSRSNETAKVHRLYRDGHATETEFRAAAERDMREIQAAQKGFAYASHGQLDWLDALRPLTGCFRGFAVRDSAGEDAVGPVTRWFRTDTFYRKPLVNRKVECDGGELARIMPSAAASSVIFLPAPYTFAHLVENSYYDSHEKLARDYAKCIAKSAKKLQEKGYGCALLSDHYVGYEQSKGKHGLPDWYASSLSEARAPGLSVGINFPLAEITEVMPHVEKSNADFVGVDATFSTSFKIETGKDLLIGAVNGARPFVESGDWLRKRVGEVVSKAGFSGRYYVGPNDRLWDVPFEIGLKKVAALAAFRGVS